MLANEPQVLRLPKWVRVLGLVAGILMGVGAALSLLHHRWLLAAFQALFGGGSVVLYATAPERVGTKAVGSLMLIVGAFGMLMMQFFFR